MKYQRRTDEERVAELNAKIEGIRERAARKAARANPAVRQATVALKAIDKALEAQPDEPLSAVLEEAAIALRGALDAAVANPTPTEPSVPKRRARAKAATTA